jgi:DNA repair protein RadD
MSQVSPRPMQAVQVASIDTLLVRGVRSSAMDLPPADLVIFDEAHRARGRTREHLISLYPEAALLGMTATPCRSDGRGLGNLFDVMIECPQVADLIVGGYLVKSRVYAPVNPDLKGVRVEKGDYVISQLAGRMNTEALVGDIVEHWYKHGEGRCTVAFAVDVAHSVAIRNQFLGAGVRAEHLDGETPLPERADILARLASGETKVVSNCMVLTEGWDSPPVGCTILARPTKQMALFRQMVGRVLRPADGKPDAVILDHSGAVFRHGLPEDYVEWTLEVDGRAAAPVHEKRKAGEAPALRECPACKAVMTKPPCGVCGWVPEPKARNIDFEDGRLGLVVGGKSRAPRYTDEQKFTWHRMLIGEALRRGKNPNWAFYLFRDKFGHDRPSHWERTALEPTLEVTNFVRSRVIAFAKSGGREHVA